MCRFAVFIFQIRLNPAREHFTLNGRGGRERGAKEAAVEQRSRHRSGYAAPVAHLSDRRPVHVRATFNYRVRKQFAYRSLEGKRRATTLSISRTRSSELLRASR